MNHKLIFIYVSIIVLSFLCLSTSTCYAAFPIVANQNQQSNQVNLNTENNAEEDSQKTYTLKNKRHGNVVRTDDDGKIGIYALLVSLVGPAIFYVGASIGIVTSPILIVCFLFSVFGLVLSIIGNQKYRKNQFLSILALIISSGSIMILAFLTLLLSGF